MLRAPSHASSKAVREAFLGADMRNQSMGLMRAVLRSAKLAPVFDSAPERFDFSGGAIAGICFDGDAVGVRRVGGDWI